MTNFNDLIQTTLAESPHYYDEVIALIEKEFNYTGEHSFGEDFRLLMNPLNFDNSHFLVDKKSNRVVSHIAYSKREMISGHIRVPVIFIGAIATHSSDRGRGLFRHLMEQVLKKNQNQYALFILWSEIAGLYEKFNFFLAGTLQETGNANFDLNNPPKGFSKRRFSDLSTKEFDQIINLYSCNNEKNYFTVKRTAQHWSIIKEITSIDLFIKKNKSDEILEYFCINKGKDLKGIIHEICTSPNALPSLLKDIGTFKCWLPTFEDESENKGELFYTAYIRLGSLERLNEFLTPLSKGELVIISIGEQVSFNYQNKNFTASQQDFIQYLFGPNILDEFKNLKLSPYISGVDSV